MESVHFVESLSQVDFDDSCVLVADEALPPALLPSHPDPLFVPAGEDLKSLSSLDSLARAVLRRRSTRPLTLVAIGGGSVGDAVGFLASVLWRGVPLWQVPTTLLAAADSAHGGKTALNLGNVKNQLGTFHSASRILIAADLLGSAPPRARRDGLAEILKCLYLADAPTLRLLHERGGMEPLLSLPFAEVRTPLMDLLRTAVGIKYSIVARDPFETAGPRRLLNLGHTLGHALEIHADLSHGGAVAWGLLAALRLSTSFGLSDEDLVRGRVLLHPLLPALNRLPEPDLLHAAMRRDKKRFDSRLHSILLSAPGAPLISDAVTASDWIEALHTEWNLRRRTRLRISCPHPRPLSSPIPAGKSEMQRGMVIAALRPGPTEIVGLSQADDCRDLREGLRALGWDLRSTSRGLASPGRSRHAPEAQNHVHLRLGLGAAPLRFLLALAAARPGTTLVEVDPALFARPHEDLLDALHQAGARITPRTDSTDYQVTGWPSPPSGFAVSVSRSSQPASALALLSLALDRPLTMRLEGEPVSRPYLDLTLNMLAEAGMDVIAGDRTIALNPTPRLHEPLVLTIPEDRDILAFHDVVRSLNGEDLPSPLPGRSIRPALAALAEGRRQSRPVSLSLREDPDFLPLLLPAALLNPAGVDFTHCGHLRYKESNRLEGFADSLRGLGIRTRIDGDVLRLLPAASLTVEPEPFFPVHRDHRLVMAAALLARMRGPLLIDDPDCVSKSWVGFWDDLREAGWSTTPRGPRGI